MFVGLQGFGVLRAEERRLKAREEEMEVLGGESASRLRLLNSFTHCVATCASLLLYLFHASSPKTRNTLPCSTKIESSTFHAKT